VKLADDLDEAGRLGDAAEDALTLFVEVGQQRADQPVAAVSSRARCGFPGVGQQVDDTGL